MGGDNTKANKNDKEGDNTEGNNGEASSSSSDSSNGEEGDNRKSSSSARTRKRSPGSSPSAEVLHPPPRKSTRVKKEGEESSDAPTQALRLTIEKSFKSLKEAAASETKTTTARRICEDESSVT